VCARTRNSLDQLAAERGRFARQIGAAGDARPGATARAANDATPAKFDNTILAARDPDEAGGMWAAMFLGLSDVDLNRLKRTARARGRVARRL
jgi:hypothetical protein